ncbi:hypothetical protein JMK10_20815 [Rhodovulum sulfidophilum]|uniref:hypothetical protein n=1 Tax=Rhodovulum sulfidophilum TaxID=35806 RepID=UPI001921F2FF|nr:hypothetical protein [Rhodovulum sulfidophilum]MBL3575852.1 hypothetical protein [Rhodovulum sulfidophilum]MCE8432762.1 hypothetical protein [Rhodovulum sulfidophilum]MCF4119123.1 hypothetical protein [Rhodovulum sulfidophilum]
MPTPRRAAIREIDGPRDAPSDGDPELRGQASEHVDQLGALSNHEIPNGGFSILQRKDCWRRTLSDWLFFSMAGRAMLINKVDKHSCAAASTLRCWPR